MNILYVPEPLRSPAAPLFLSDEGSPAVALLDDELRPVKCYDSNSVQIRCPEGFNLRSEEVIVVGGAAGEVVASYLNARYVDERRVKLSKAYLPGRIETLIEAVREATANSDKEPVIPGSILAVLPGSFLRKRSWGAALIAKTGDSKTSIVAELLFDQNLRVIGEKSADLEELQRFDYWWQPPWENLFAHGKNMRRLLEILSERPVEKIPQQVLSGGHHSPQSLIESLASYISGRKLEVVGRRSLKKVVVYIDERIVKPSQGYVGVVLIKNSQRKVHARWYFDEKFRLIGFDNVPPEAVSGIDAEIAVGRVPREVQARLPEALAAFLVRIALLTPVRIADYLAVKAHRWYEIALL